jgi:hypothetical protein
MASPYDSAIAQAEAANGIPTGLLHTVIGAESNYNPAAFNPASGAAGIGQFLPSTAADPGYGIAPFNPADPFASISAAGQYLKAMFAKTGSWAGAVQAYGTTTSMPQTQGQQAVWTAANAADNSGSGITGANLAGNQPSPSGYGSASLIPVASGGTGLAGKSGAAGVTGQPLLPDPGLGLSLGVAPDLAKWASGLAAAIGKGFTDAVSSFFSSIENLVTRGFLIIVGIVIVALALWRLLAPNVSLKDAAMLAA